MRKKILVSLFCLLLPTVLFADQLSQENITKLIKNMETAASKKDADGVLKFISPKAKITLTAMVNGKTQKVQLQVPQYKAMLEQGWKVAQNYKFKRSDTKIQIDQAAKKATITATIDEEVEIQGKKISSKTNQKSTVEVINGKLMITDLNAKQIK